MGDVVSRDEVNRSLGRGAVGIATGLGILSLGALPVISILGFSLLPLGIGVALVVAGQNNLKKHEGSLGGIIALGAGVLTFVSGLPFIGGLGGFFLTTGAIGALVYGGMQIYRFVKGLKSRS